MAEAPAEVPATPVRIDAGLLSCQVLAEVPSRCASLLRRGAVRLWCLDLGEAPRKFASARSLWHSQSSDTARTPIRQCRLRSGTSELVAASAGRDHCARLV